MNIINRLRDVFTAHADRLAISEDDRSVTYGALHQKSLRIANWLTQQGIKNSCIAIELNDAIEHIIAITGVVLSGNFYISITEENKPFFTSENKLPIRLALCDNGKSGLHTNYVPIETIFRQEQIKPGRVATDDIDPQAKVCAFFTSGSTGASKIVIHNHETIYYQTLLEISENEITCLDKLDFVFSVSFSASLSCIFPALLSGAELCIFNLKEKGLHQLASFWKDKAVTFSTLSVSSFQAVCKITPTLRNLTALRFVCISAEPVKDTTIVYFKEKFPVSCTLQIAYATTETRTIADIKILNDGTLPMYPDSLGIPAHGKIIYILDDEGQKLEPGAIGEIVVESGYIADEYYGQPEESALSFTLANGLVQYKTGDLGYLNSEGYLYYTGRKKNEIKINGVKINIANIECEIERTEGILQAVTVINISKPAQPKLLSFYKTDGRIIPAEHIRKGLVSKLPASHIPQFYIQTDQFPLTHSGKIDRKTLEQTSVDETKVLISAITSAEKTAEYYESTIVEIFKNVLEVSKVDRDSNFFDLGGDSLNNLICIAEMERKFNRTLQSFILLPYPTPAKLAGFLFEKQDEETGLVKVIAVNGYQEGRKNLYIIHRKIFNKYDPISNSSLYSTFNLIYLYFDLKSIYAAGSSYKLLMDELARIIGKNREAIVMGSSFNGYIAHQLSCLVPEISHCILIDTFNYFEHKPLSSFSRMKFIFQHSLIEILQNKDYGLPIYLAKYFYSQLHLKARKRTKTGPLYYALILHVSKKIYSRLRVMLKIGTKYNSTFNDDLYQFLAEYQHKKCLNDCIYFQASRTKFKYLNFHKDWKPYANGNFHCFRLVSDHSHIMPDHISFISDHIERIAYTPSYSDNALTQTSKLSLQ